jgi:energy-coupling factor transporter ATP-binding protein EcfA2
LQWKEWAPVVTNERNEVLTYTASQMSDGERAALYLGAKVMLAPKDSVMVVDEPETHFHSLLAIALWDALEAQRADMRFVYVTHDLSFAMSRQDATFLLANGAGKLDVVALEDDLPSELKKSILGAASFSYYASRVVFCEGEAHSLDTKILTAWFRGRDTVVSAVGSCDGVRACVSALCNAKIVDNLDAIGVIDRDFRPDEFFTSLTENHIILPVHEIEGLICVPEVCDALADHLGRDRISVVDQISNVIGDSMVMRVTYDRWKAVMLGRLENKVTAKPPKPLTEEGLRGHAEAAFSHRDLGRESVDVLETELVRVSTDRDSGDVMRMLKTFPSKQLAGVVSSCLGQSVGQSFELMSRALLAADDSPLFSLGQCLEAAFTTLGLPVRQAELRITEPASP